ncbi:MAG TPA: SPFH domain-containing protein [Methylocella sp.]|nr:SPFH domain-containing protein [Methylocella sp.]
MGAVVFFTGLIAIGLAIVENLYPIGLPVGFVYHPLFWLAYLALLTAVTVVKFVRQQETIVIERLGRYNRTLTAGINIVWPLVERGAFEFDLRERVIDVPAQEAITKDNATVTIDGFLYYKIVNAKDAAYGAHDIRRAIINLAQTTMRSAIGSMELDKTFEQRAEINEKVVKAVAEAAQTWGAQVTRYEIKDIRMPQSLRDSMERQMKAERDKRAVVLESEGIKQSQINRAEGERQSAILRSEGQRLAAINVAQGQAEAIRLVREQINQHGGAEAVQLEVAKAALEQYGKLAKQGNSLIIMGDHADPSGWLAKAMGVLKTAGASPVPSMPSNHSPIPPVQ